MNALRKMGGLLTCLALLGGLLTVSAAAAVSPGVYTGTVTTSYYNPDTGNVDDGGTANAALGEGMCRSATDTTGLVEVDSDGNIWLTIRLLLQSSCKNVALYTRTGNDSYSAISYTIMAEDSGNDSIDYRFKVTDAEVKLKGTMYVTPMGRDVLWYLWVDTSTLKEGSGDFVVSIDTSSPAPETPATTPATPATTPATPATIPATPATPATTPAATGDATTPETPAQTTDPADEPSTEQPGESQNPTETDDPDQTSGEPNDPAESTGTTGTEQPEESQAPADGQTGTDETAPTEDSGGISSGAVAGIVVAVIVIAGIAYFVIRRKK